MDVYFDHYTGFESEPEVIFRSADGKQKANLWHGYFSYIMKNAVPNEAGYWENLALIYHTCTGWYASSPFELSQVNEAICQLQICYSNLWENDTLQAYNNLVSVFEYASKNKFSIFVEYS